MDNMDFDLFVIGAGSGGIRAARFSAEFGARVGIAEERYLGGTCVNVGCIPKKLLVYSSEYANELTYARSFGWSIDSYQFDWNQLINNKNKEIIRLNNLYKSLIQNSKVILYEAHAKLINSNTIQVGKYIVQAKHILISSGSWPFIPDIPGREYAITSNEVFSLNELPKRMLILGGGYIAAEFASIFNNLNVKTTQVCRSNILLRNFDSDISKHLKNELLNKGIDFHFNSNIISIQKLENKELIVLLSNGKKVITDCVLIATGRRPMIDGLGLENTEVETDQNGFIKVDLHNQTTDSCISAIGDITKRSKLTPTALAEGMAVSRRLFKPDEYKPVDWNFVPSAVFSLPNVATVGLTEEEARAQNGNISIFKSLFKPLQLSLTSSSEKVLIKMIVDNSNDQILGCHMVGPMAGEILQGIAVALKTGATKQVFDETIGIHPTLAEEFVSLRKPQCNETKD